MIRRLADLTVDRARVRRTTPDSRAHLTAALMRVSPAAVGVPADALLLVRRLCTRARLGPGHRADLFAADLQETLRERLSRARAPGAAGPDDDLLVRDEAELAAAVIAAWLDGDPLAIRTWRLTVTAGKPPPAWWRTAILPDARLMPRVIAALARQGRAAAWIARLDPAEIVHALRLLADAHGQPQEPAALAFKPQPFSAARAISERADRRAEAAVLAIAPEAAAAALTGPARALIALALVLDRRPAFVRTALFARALIVIGTCPAPLPAARDTAVPEQAQSAVTGHAPSPTHDAPDAASPARAWRPLTAARQASVGLLMPSADAPVETRYGGLFFLLNALIAMEVYGDFTRPLAVPHAPSPFDLLALLGRRWFGAQYRRDPVDALLAGVVGRHPDEPIRSAPPQWSPPGSWLAPWPAASPTAGWHPAGFPLYPAPDDRRLPGRPMTRWTASLALYLEARLALALAMSPRAAVRGTCRQPANVTCSGDRVTLTFSLAAHPLALRLAGLDRDPGYLPAARREVRFAFA